MPFLRKITKLLVILTVNFFITADVAAEQPDIPILLYHHVADLPATASRAQKRWTLSPEKFDEQMQWIKKHGFHPITMLQLDEHLKHNLTVPVKPIIISFDDGWKDQYTSAFPILKKHGFPATFFIITASVGHSAYMTWDQIKEMSAAGMDIESHSHTHPRLSILSYEKAEKEIIESKKILESHLNKPVSVFAYPFGSYDDNLISIIKDAGFETAATISGLNGGYFLRTDKSYTLSRYAVEADDNLNYVSQLKSLPVGKQNKKEPVCTSLFISLVQDPSIFSSRKGITSLIDFADQSGIKTLFVQIYRENKAWFPSKVADSSPYEKCRANLSEDPFALLIKRAHEKGIAVHAWLNLLSLAQNQDSKFLKKYGTSVLTKNLKKKKNLNDYLIDAQYFLEPGDKNVQEDLSKIISELLTAYPGLDGIQFDYIRYPDTEPHYGYTQSNIKRFKKATGLWIINEESLVWKNWKRAQVTELLTQLVKTIHTLRPGIQISATGCMPYARAYYEAYQDWPLWVNTGLIDFITLMNYSPDPVEFKRWLSVVKEKVPDISKIKIGIGAYKLTQAPEIFNKELQYVEELGMTGAIFHYGSLLESPKLKSAVIEKNK